MKDDLMYDFSLRFSGCEIDRPSTLHNFGMFFFAFLSLRRFPRNQPSSIKIKHPTFSQNGRTLQSNQLLSPPLRTAGMTFRFPQALGIISPKAQVMRPEKAGREERRKSHGEEGRKGGKLLGLSEAQVSLWSTAKKGRLLFLFFLGGGRRGRGKRVVGCLDRVFVAIKRTFWTHFFGIFFSKKQKSSTNSFWQNFAKRLGPKTSFSELPDLCRAPQEVCPKKNPKQRRWDRSKRCPMGAIIAPW